MKTIKKIITNSLCILLATGVFSCSSGENTDYIPLGNRTIKSIEFEGCEYIYLRRYGSVDITHKGNCKNPEHACH